ncbi:hypothetical protein AUP44_03815 [Tistrella mobilis]|uniref:Uncharacterized protein n=1 Tax=Tistrella mobilis TaxID=171437 RepID=A0A162L675_9PROT|nr:hypothetical protein AUP44_03815 [Tistrella mobilis]
MIYRQHFNMFSCFFTSWITRARYICLHLLNEIHSPIYFYDWRQNDVTADQFLETRVPLRHNYYPLQKPEPLEQALLIETAGPRVLDLP